MLPGIPAEFELDYSGSRLVYGRGRVDEIGAVLDRNGRERALVVTGSHVGANDAVMGPLRRGLGDRLAGVFDGTTPEKRAAEAYEGIEVMREVEPDVLVGVGGGSSLDVARQMSVFAADGRSLSELREQAQDGGIEPPDPDGPLTPVVVVPTTFAGADVSSGGSIQVLDPEESPTGQPIRTSGRCSPEAVVYDPALFETTPMDALAGSAMNGFNKGVESIYSRAATPITDATAVRGLALLRNAFLHLPGDAETMDRAVVGIILVQYRRRVSIVHAFGHGFSRRYDLQQGVAHAVMVPHVLEYLFEHVDARRDVLAEALGVADHEVPEELVGRTVIDSVVGVRDALDLPRRLRELDPVAEADLRAIAEFVIDDPAMRGAPEGLEPTVDELEDVLREAW